MIATGKSTRLLSVLTVWIALIARSFAAEIPPLDSFPSSKDLWIAVDEATLEAAKQKVYRATNSEPIKLLKPHGSLLKKGEHWATLAPKQLDFEQRTLEITRNKVKKELTELEDKQADFIEKTQEAILKLQSQTLELELSLKDRNISPTLRKRIKTLLRSIKEKKQRLEAKISKEELQAKFNFEKQKLDLERDKSEKSFLHSQRRAELKAPFDGVLKYSLEEPENLHTKQAPLWIESNEVFASISDETHYELKLSNRNPSLQGSSLHGISAKAEVGFNRLHLYADYLTTRQVAQGTNTMRDMHVFKISPKSINHAKGCVGEKLAVHLFRTFEEPHYIVRKKSLSGLAPEILKTSGWVGLITHLYPGAKISAVGPDAIAIQK